MIVKLVIGTLHCFNKSNGMPCEFMQKKGRMRRTHLGNETLFNPHQEGYKGLS